MFRIILLLALLLYSQYSFSDSATQTDWSGSYGGAGPVSFWTNHVSQMESADYFNSPGNVSLCCRANLIYSGIQRMFSCVSDIDMDGDVDIVGRSQYVDGLFWLENEELGSNWVQHFITVSGDYAYWLWLSDFDSDGDEDLLASWGTYNPNDGEIVIFENTGGVFWPEWIVADNVPGTMSSFDPFCCPIDVDGDADIDIVGEYWTGVPPDHTLHIAWWENSGYLSDNWAEHIICSSEIWRVVESMHAGDKDQDGDADVVINVECVPEDSTFWIEQEETETWTLHPVEDDHVYMLGFFDFNCDSFLDILINEGDYIYWLEEVSPEVWESRHIEDSLRHSTRTWSCDFDEDGDLDVYGSGWELVWWENLDGSGLAWEEHLINPLFCYGNANICDIDLDGYTDVILPGWYDPYWVETELFSDTAWLESQILDVGSCVYWDSIAWVADIPSNTDMCLQVRTEIDATTPPIMDNWSQLIYEPGDLSRYIHDNRRFFQYAVLLTTSNPAVTPVLNEVTVSWFGTAIGNHNPLIQQNGLITCSPNPAIHPSIGFYLDEPSAVNIKVYDMLGRVVFHYHSDNESAGIHDFILNDLTPGVYFCRMITGSTTDTRSFVVIE